LAASNSPYDARPVRITISAAVALRPRCYEAARRKAPHSYRKSGQSFDMEFPEAEHWLPHACDMGGGTARPPDHGQPDDGAAMA
jgi:hypothetical protein